MFDVTQVSSVLDDDDEGVTPIIIPTMSSKHKSAAPPPTATATLSSAQGPSPSASDVDAVKPASVIDVTADDILPRLTSPNVTDLVLLSMVLQLQCAAAVAES